VEYNLPTSTRSAFILDTIHINNPIIIEYKNIRYVVDTSIDSIPMKNINYFIENTSHYLLGDNIYYDLPFSLHKRIPNCYIGGFCNYILEKERKHYDIYSFREKPIFFVLVALNVSVFNKKHTSIDAPQYIRRYSPINTYVLFVYPECKVE
jgi:conserved domain protein (fragment)